MIDVPLPSLGPDMESGTLLQWHVKPGDTVHKGSILAVVDTTKAAIDVESWHEGTVESLLAQAGDTIAVGAIILRLATGGERNLAPATTVRDATVPARQAATVPAAQPRASPAARKQALERGIDLAALKGSGPGGAITLTDVTAAAAAGITPAPEPVSKDPADRRSSVRAAIAASMTRSHREIPHYYLWEDCDVSHALHWMQQRNELRPVEQRLVFAALLVSAVAHAAHEFPDMNGTYEKGEFHPGSTVNLGVAVALRGGGLIAPAIADAQSLSLDQTMQQLSDLVRRARSGGLRSTEVSAQTLTITQLGDEGVRGILGVIHPPQVALIGIGKPRDRAVVVAGQVAVRTCVTISLSADHRVSDGRQGSRFLTRIVTLLQEPEKW